MAKKKELTKATPAFPTITKNGKTYFRTRLTDADGERFDLYGKTEEELAQKIANAQKEIEEAKIRRMNPTVEEYCEKWLHMQSANIRQSTLDGYTKAVNKYIVKPLGHLLMSEVTSDDIKVAMVPVSKKSVGLYSTVNMLLKSIFYSAEYSNLIDENPAACLNAKGGIAKKQREALSDEQVKLLLETIRDLPPYLFVMIGLYAGLRREEILGLQWDCVFLDRAVPYISVRRAWHPDHNRPVVTTDLKTKAARRDIPIPKCLVDCLSAEKERSTSKYVISNNKGEPLAASQFQRIWRYITIRSTRERTIYRYVNGQAIKKQFKPKTGEKCSNRPKIVYCIDFDVSPHLLRHTYITNLIHAGVDPKTVQYLAGHENSKITMDIYAKVKYNKPEQLLAVVDAAFTNGEAVATTSQPDEQ